MSLARRIAARAFEPRDIASLAVFRVCFGLLMAWEVAKFFWKGWIEQFYVRPTFTFTYWGFEWVRPLPAPALYAVFGALFLAALGIAAGWAYRACAAVFALGFTYVFLLERANYLNHYYFICILAVLMAAVPAHRALSVDARVDPALRADHVPAWTLWLLRFQLAIVYGYAGLAKLDPDWLLGTPFSLWILGHQDHPIAWLMGRVPRPGMVFSFAGLLYDLLVVPGLLWRRTRAPFMAATFAFHLMNASLFHIGVFPFLMLCATPLLTPPDWPRRFGLMGPAGPPPPQAEDPPSGARGWVLGLLGAWAVVQVLLPLRGLAYPGNTRWTGQGHLFAWRMMLINKRLVDARIRVVERAGRTYDVRLEDYLTSTQLDGLTHAENVPQLCRRIARDVEAASGQRPAVFADVRVSMNGSAAAPLVDPRVDLAAVEDGLGPAPWILPRPGPRLAPR